MMGCVLQTDQRGNEQESKMEKAAVNGRSGDFFFNVLVTVVEMSPGGMKLSEKRKQDFDCGGAAGFPGSELSSSLDVRRPRCGLVVM